MEIGIFSLVLGAVPFLIFHEWDCNDRRDILDYEQQNVFLGKSGQDIVLYMSLHRLSSMQKNIFLMLISLHLSTVIDGSTCVPYRRSYLPSHKRII